MSRKKRPNNGMRMTLRKLRENKEEEANEKRW